MVVVVRPALPALVMFVVLLSACTGKAPLPSGGPLEATANSLAIVDPAGDVAGVADAIGANVTETPTHLRIEIRLASLPSGGPNALGAMGYRFVSWAVCWHPLEDSRSTYPRYQECAGVGGEIANGVADLRGFLEVERNEEEGCNDWSWCAWNLPYTLLAGAPGLVRVEVPRAMLGGGEAGDWLNDTAIVSFSAQGDAVQSTVLGSRAVYVYARAAGIGNGARVPLYGPNQLDRGQGDDFVFKTPRLNETVAPAGQTLFVDAARDVGGGAEGYRPEYDLLSADLLTGPKDLQVKIKVGQVDGSSNHELYFSLGLGAHVYEVGYTAIAGLPQEAWGGYCTNANCDTWVEFTPKVEFQRGSPGTIMVTVQRSELAALEGGERANLADFYLYEPWVGRGFGAPNNLVYAGLYAMGPGDWAWGAQPVVVASAA